MHKSGPKQTSRNAPHPRVHDGFLRRLVCGLRWRVNALLPWNLDITPPLKVPFEVYGNKGASFGIVSTGLKEQSVVYSFGVGEDISFDIALIEKFGVSVYAFDPTPKSLEWLSQQDLPDRFHMNPVAVGDREGYDDILPA